MDTPYTVFVHLLDANGNLLASADAEPGNGEFPTTGWIENEYIADVHAAIANIPPGTYQIEIGLYDPITGARLKTGNFQERILIDQFNVP
jgi:hypothetical protein